MSYKVKFFRSVAITFWIIAIIYSFFVVLESRKSDVRTLLKVATRSSQETGNFQNIVGNLNDLVRLKILDCYKFSIIEPKKSIIAKSLGEPCESRNGFDVFGTI